MSDFASPLLSPLPQNTLINHVACWPMSDVHFNEVGTRKRGWCFQNLHLTPWRVFLFLSVRIICSHPWPHRTKKTHKLRQKELKWKKKSSFFSFLSSSNLSQQRGGAKKIFFSLPPTSLIAFPQTPKEGQKSFHFWQESFFLPSLSLLPPPPPPPSAGDDDECDHLCAFVIIVAEAQRQTKTDEPRAEHFKKA